MTNGLVKGRKRFFYKGYAVEWFSTVMKTTKIIINAKIDQRWGGISEITLDYVADDFSVEEAAKAKIDEIESL